MTLSHIAKTPQSTDEPFLNRNDIGVYLDKPFVDQFEQIKALLLRCLNFRNTSWIALRILQLLSDERHDFWNVPQSNKLLGRSPHCYKLCIPAGNLSLVICCQHSVCPRFQRGSDQSQRIWQIIVLFFGIAVGHIISSSKDRCRSAQ